MNLQEEFYNRIDNDNGYDNQKLGDDLIEIAKKHLTKQFAISGVSNSVICCPQCGNERLESTGGGWYICGDRSCDWGDKL